MNSFASRWRHPDDEAAAHAPEERGGFGSLGSILLLLVLTWAAFLALVPLNDNSFFTHLATGRIILVSVIDNLLKGAAGQAVQNFNLLIGADERTGLL